MVRTPGQSDFVFERPAELPAEELVAKEASARATRWVMRATFVLLFLLAVLCAVGPHIPSGE